MLGLSCHFSDFHIQICMSIERDNPEKNTTASSSQPRPAAGDERGWAPSSSLEGSWLPPHSVQLSSRAALLYVPGLLLSSRHFPWWGISSLSSLKATFPSLPFFFICEVLFQCLSSHLFLLLFFFSFLLLRSQYFITERELNVILTLHRKMLFVRSARWVPNTQKQESRQTWLPPSSVGPYRGTIKQCWFILIPHLAFVLPQGIQPLFERLNLFIPI